jgi:sugar phosphate isomerase/epimerase
MVSMYGMPALIGFSTVEENVELALRLGLDFVELNMNMPYCLPSRLEADHLRDLTAETGIRFTLHMPDELDVGSLYPAIREGNLRTCLEALEWAKRAGVELINLHLYPGIYFTLPDEKVWIYAKYFDQYLYNVTDSFTRITGKGIEGGVTVCVENVTNFQLPFIARTIDELCRMEGFNLTYDVGHDARTGYRERDVLLRHRDRLAHMHLHDVKRGEDHKVLFSGEIDILGMIALADERGMSVCVETKTVDSLRTSIIRLRERGLIA